MDANAVENVLYLADSYKVTHHLQYPPGTSYVYSYYESRGGKFSEVCFFGLQYIIKRWLVGPVVTEKMVEEARTFYRGHFRGQPVFNYEGWMHIVKKHSGRLPLRIKAVPEGSVIPVKNVLITVENTDPEVPWLTNWFETLLVQVWYPTTVCTISRQHKIAIANYLHETSDSLRTLRSKLHDFGYRGSTSIQSAGIGGAAHLVNFSSTDTVAALLVCKKFYGHPMAAETIPASEHSTMTSWGKENEANAYKNMLQQFPNTPVSVVSDSYDIYNAVENIWGRELRELVSARTENNCLVIRPDSGNPREVVIKVLNLLAKNFECRKNKKGYRVLPDYIRLLQGDGVCYETLNDMLKNLKSSGWSAENLAFGAGGALLQKMDRDTQKFAMKCSMVIVHGKEVNVFKDPITDAAKTSKKGRLTLECNNGVYETIQEGQGDPKKDLLITVFENGTLLRDYSLDEIRLRAEIDLVKATSEMTMNGGK
uniref:Nicotinamide phosphoribosyltransferase n=1 Tax=Romanomermis culicivorax TaxID=13658 RepID=A0A915JL69_ROMCU